MNACYCDGYGICFGSARKLDAWLAKLRVWELEEERLEKLEANNAPESEIAQSKTWIDKLNSELSLEKAAAYERGDDEKSRAMERERVW